MTLTVGAGAVAVLGALAASLLVRPTPVVAGDRLGGEAPDPPPAPRRTRYVAGVVVVGGLAVALVGASLPGRVLALAAIASGLVLAVGRSVRRARASRLADLRAEQVLELCEALAADLVAGQPPLRCLERAAAQWPELAPAAAAGRMGADVPSAFRLLADRPGGRQLRTLAASWAVAQETGAGLARSVQRAAEAVRAERRTARLVAAELASARATARLLGVLPVLVLLLGTGLGGDPAHWLLRTTPGVVCLGTGVALSVAGMRWLEAVADRVLGR